MTVTPGLATGPAGIFLSRASARLDEKGRLAIPARYRGAFDKGLVCTRGLDRCVYILPIPEFLALYERLKEMPQEDEAAREYLSGFLSDASDEAPDKQGRIALPPHLREYAGLDRDVVVAGVGDHLEVWDAAAHAARSAASVATYSNAAKEVVRYLHR